MLPRCGHGIGCMMKILPWMGSLALCAACTRPVGTRAPTSTRHGIALRTDVEVAPIASGATDRPVWQATGTSPLPIFSGALSQDDWIVFTERPGASVTLRVIAEGGGTLVVHEGERVRFHDEDSGLGEGVTTATVSVRGVRGTIPNTSLLHENRLHRSPDGRWALFGAIRSCEGVCRSELWVLGANGARLRLCPEDAPACGAAEHRVLWSPNGRTLVVSSGGLHLVDLTDGRVRSVPALVSPVFSPGGRLFARQHGPGGAVVEVTPVGPLRTVVQLPNEHPSTEGDVAPVPVVFEGVDRLCAVFLRGDDVHFRRATLDGTAVRGDQPCAR